MSTKKLSAGDIIESRCTRCRDILNHRIVAMVADKVVRVECNTCGGVHNYYPPPSAKEAREAKAPRTTRTAASSSSRSTAPTSAKARREAGEAERDEWASLRPNMQIDRALPYNMNSSFKIDNLLDHPTFGLGVVRQLVPPNKMQVLFEDGLKLLRCK